MLEEKNDIGSLALPLDVRCVTPGTTLKQTVEILQSYNIGCVLIKDKDKVVGIFTERDYLMRVALKGIDEAKVPVGEFMTPNPRAVKKSEPIATALLLMRMGRFRHLVVENDEGEMISVLSSKDLMDYLADKVQKSV